MRVGAVGMSPYVYNTNAISSVSMNKIQGIGSDVTASKSDFSGLTGSGENTNPLRIGETKNFADVIGMQMQMGRMNAARVMDVNPFATKPTEDASANAAVLDATVDNMQSLMA